MVASVAFVQVEALHTPWAHESSGCISELFDPVPSRLSSPVGFRHWAPESVKSPARAPEHCDEILLFSVNIARPSQSQKAE